MSPRRKLSDARRRQILKAAVQVIAEKGLCDTGIKDVADQAGTSPALVIYYFGKKDILLAEALSFADEKFYALDGPIVRVTTPHLPLPSADVLEDAAIPSVDRIVDGVRRSLG